MIESHSGTSTGALSRFAGDCPSRRRGACSSSPARVRWGRRPCFSLAGGGSARAVYAAVDSPEASLPGLWERQWRRPGAGIAPAGGSAPPRRDPVSRGWSTLLKGEWDRPAGERGGRAGGRDRLVGAPAGPGAPGVPRRPVRAHPTHALVGLGPGGSFRGRAGGAAGGAVQTGGYPGPFRCVTTRLAGGLTCGRASSSRRSAATSFC